MAEISPTPSLSLERIKARATSERLEREYRRKLTQLRQTEDQKYAEKDRTLAALGQKAKVVVNRTRDGGKSFETLSEGLPGEHAYDLVYRHALDIDATGMRLAMGSTTGALWVSEDQGDRWTAVSANLPPVYCVRFAAQ